MTTRDLCEYAGCSRQTLQRWRALGLLPEPVSKTSNGRGVRVEYDAERARQCVDEIRDYRARGWSLAALAETKGAKQR